MKQGWEIKTLLEVSVSIEDGDWIEKKDQSTSGIRLIQTGNIGLGYYKDTGEKAKYISEDTFAKLKCTELTIGDVLVSRLPDPVGRACILPDLGVRCITAVDCSIIKLKQDIIYPQWFVYYSLSSEYGANVKKECSGTTRERISRKKLSCITIPIPPLVEQERIVEILDREFEKIDALKANAEQNLQHAKDLFQSALKQELQPKEGWVSKTVGEVCTLKSGNSNANNSSIGTLPFVKVGDMNIQGNEEEITYSTMYVSREENIRGIFPIGSVIFPKRGGAILTNKKRITATEICCDLNIMGVYSNGDVIPNLLYFYFLGVDLSEIYNGAAIPQINNGDIAPLNISFPKDIVEQQNIVDKLNSLKLSCKVLKENYTKTMALCDDMKQALLRQAFNGEL